MKILVEELSVAQQLQYGVLFIAITVSATLLVLCLLNSHKLKNQDKPQE